MNYTQKFDSLFVNDLKFIQDNELIAPQDWGFFDEQFHNELKALDSNWKELSKPTKYGLLEKYGYRKRYMHSIPEKEKKKRNWTGQKAKSDLRIVFKVREKEKVIYYLGIGKRIKGLPKDPRDVWARIRHRPIPDNEIN